jgi:hypothetical protein
VPGDVLGEVEVDAALVRGEHLLHLTHDLVHVDLAARERSEDVFHRGALEGVLGLFVVVIGHGSTVASAASPPRDSVFALR